MLVIYACFFMLFWTGFKIERCLEVKYLLPYHTTLWQHGVT